LFSPLLLLILPNSLSGWLLVLLGELVLFCRAVEPLLDTRSRMLVAGLGVAAFLVFFPAWLVDLGRRGAANRAPLLGSGLALGVSLSILFRALDSGLDLTTAPGFQWIGWILALAASALLPLIIRAAPPLQPEPAPTAAARKAKASPVIGSPVKARQTIGSRKRTVTPIPPEAGNPLLLTLGLFSVLILLYFAFTTPAVITRWTEGSYPIILFLVVLGLVVFAAYAPPLGTLAPSALAGVNLVFALSLVGTLFTNAVAFPGDPASFPVDQPPAPDFAAVLLSVALVLSPILIVNFTRFTRGLVAARPSLRRMGYSFSLGALYLLVMIFAHVFTTVYDYIPVIGPFFRDRFWLVYLLPAIVLILVLLKTPVGRPSTGETPRFSMAVIALVGLLAVAAAMINAPRPVPAPERDSLRVLTYNIQQGYRADGQRGYADQLAVLRQVDADLIGLQESDTARISGGNTDLVRYFADQLGLYSTTARTVTGTFGIALLSNTPSRCRTFYVQRGEQTAAIHPRYPLRAGLQYFRHPPG
jgi:hypothetical protein